MIDLRQQFYAILQKYGHNILLQRRDLTAPAHGPFQLTSNNGFKRELERHTVRHRYPVNTGLAGSMDEAAEGMVHNVDMIYYFRHEVSPKEGDRIYEKDDRYQGLEPYPGFSTYIISYAVPMKGRGGQITYWVAGAKREWPN